MKKIDITEYVETLNELLKKGKTLQLEYNHQTNEIKMLVCDMKRLKLK